jgi:hypothetical protein
MTARIITLALAALAIVACQDITRSTIATRDVIEDTLVVFPFSGSPLAAPTAIDLFGPMSIRVGQGRWVDAPYDLVVDTAAGEAVLQPSQLVTTEAPETAILQVTTPFDSIPEAPTTGYQDTASVSLAPGETVVVRARNRCSGGFAGRDFFYAKVQLLELTMSSGFRSLRFRVRSNPNCGFRSFADGLPGF